MSDIDLAAIREKLRKVDVLSGISGAAARADLDAICEDLAFNDVADLLAEIDRLRAENAAMREVVDKAVRWHTARTIPLYRTSLWSRAMSDAIAELSDAVVRYDAAQGEKRERN